MKRKITDNLIAWKNQPQGRRPLALQGARQVGKTHILREFGAQHYQNVAYVNFEMNLAVSSYFSENIEPRRLLRFLETETGQRIIPGKTLVIFDEIQYCERALTALKYFHEQTPEYHIACAGSLLGVAAGRGHFSFPVGNVDTLTMFPCDFEEFLWALKEERLLHEIKKAFVTNKALPAALHERAGDLYRLYLIIGGMPLALAEYIQSGSLLPVADAQNKIVNDYLADMAKGASGAEITKMRAAYNSIPLQLAKENKKFQYKLVQKGATAAILGPALSWLCGAGIALKCGRITEGRMPLAVYYDPDSFKLYMSDTGLLTMKSGISRQTVLGARETDNAFLSALSENYVAQALTAKQYSLFYWNSEGRAEVDFVLQQGKRIIAVELRNSGHVKSKNMAMFAQKYQPAYAIRISGDNFGIEHNIKSVPYYAVFCI